MAAADGYELRLIEDHIADGCALDPGPGAVNRIVYVVHGAIEIGERPYRDDTAWHGRGSVKIAAAPGGAVVWRWELAHTTTAKENFSPSERSHLKLRQTLAWPIADSLLMRSDSVSFPPGGCAYLHTHQGPGIRCLTEGGIRIDTAGTSHSYGPGNAWFEPGPEPVFAQAAADRPTRFIRVMVLPARLKGQSSIAYVNADDREKPKSQRYKIYLDEPIGL
jgi:quercetin dioxygenase-like cupin family protein